MNLEQLLASLHRQQPWASSLFVGDEGDNDNDGGGGGETPPEGEKLYSKEEFETRIKQRINPLMGKLRAAEEKQAELAKQNEKLAEIVDKIKEEKELEGATEVQKLTAQYDKKLQKLTEKLEAEAAEKADLASTVAQREESLKQTRLSHAFGSALDANGVYQKGRDHALRVLMTEIRDAEISEDGKITATWGDIPGNPSEIAEEFLKASPHFVAAKGGGAGTKGPGGSPSSPDTATTSAGGLIRAGLQQQQNN